MPGHSASRPRAPAPEVTLEALGNATRRAIIRTLAEGPMAVGDIAARLPVSRPAVSKHLRVLGRAGLVRHESQGTKNVFRLERSGFDAARGWLGAFWDQALSRFAMVAENTSARRRRR
jgi:DNA-binding transcriptional ArsR family regulator